MYPVLITLNELKQFNLNSFFDIMDNPEVPVVNHELSDTSFKKLLYQMYLPIIQFVDSNNIQASLLCTGNFLDRAAELCPEIIVLIKDMVHAKGIDVVAGPYFGENLTCIYNFNWWLGSIHKTSSTMKKILDIAPQSVYIPELFRKLPLERVTEEIGINTFIIPNSQKRLRYSKRPLSDIRKENGETLPWIDKKKDTICYFWFIPDYLHFVINGNQFRSEDVRQAVTTCSMAIGYESSELKLKHGIPSRATPIGRLYEKPTYKRYNVLAKSIIRLWEYMSMITLSEYTQNPDNTFWQGVYEQLAVLQNEDFLLFMNTENYSLTRELNFNSPYETFVFVQVATHQLEVFIEHSI